jgi:serine/threonine protein kinase
LASTLRWDDLNFVKELGEGQASHVWLATVKRATGGLSTNEKVAVKRYKPWVLQEPGQYERVLRELAASVRIRHPHVIQNICLVSDSEGRPALVMRYHDGKSLESIIAESWENNARLPISEVFRFLAALIDAVTALHTVGIYHRDIKPANIIIENGSDAPILMDLGVVSNFLSSGQTQTKSFLGTIRYADPGYLTGASFTAASDWYSLGLVGYELFFGTRFLASEEHWAKLVAHKVSSKLPSEDDLAKNYRDLSELSGQDTAEAVFYTLTTLLTSPEPAKLQRLRNAISLAFWTKPFFENTEGELVPGEPPEVPTFDFSSHRPEDRPHSRSGVQERLGTAYRRLSGICSKREYNEEVLLTNYLKSHYWKWRVSGVDATDIGIFSMYCCGGGDDTTYTNLYINTGIMALYRYGYL